MLKNRIYIPAKQLSTALPCVVEGIRISEDVMRQIVRPSIRCAERTKNCSSILPSSRHRTCAFVYVAPKAADSIRNDSLRQS